MTTPRDFSEPPPSVVTTAQLRTSAGAPITVTVTITNHSAEARVFAVTALGVDSSWLPRPSRSQPIPPGERISAVLTLRPSEGTVPARYPLAIAVQALDPVSQQAVSATTVNEVDLIVDAPGQISLTLDPADTTAVFGKKMSVLLHNSGALPENVYLEVRAPGSADIDLRRGPVFVPPGTTVAVRGRANVGRPSFFRRKARHSYTVTARSGGAPRFVEGSLTARPMLGPVGTKFFAILAVVAVWVALAFIFIPKLADSTHKGQANAAPAKTKTSTAAGKGGKGGKSGGTGGGGGQSGQPDGTGSGGSGGAGGAGPAEVQLNGTVTGNSPGGVKVALSPTTLGSTDTTGATAVGTSTQSARVGKIPAAALALSTQTAVSDRSVTTHGDGAWTFPKIRAVGYYLVQFSKPGYQTQRFIIDASAAIATQPLKVALAPGEGSLRGIVHNAKGGVVGGATVVISDGANTLTTSSNSTGGAIGNWSVKGLSTPSTYVVSVTRAGLGTESQLVTLTAGGSGVVNLTLRSGVSTLTGMVSVLLGNHRTGLGGARISATKGNVTRTASTVTTGNQLGTYTLPDLTLGLWSITMQADGYQLQSRTVRISAGQPLARVNSTLSPATAVVRGFVQHGGTRLIGAGLTMANSTNTYKQTTDNDGAFSFDGVAPGVYTLTAQFFGMDTAYHTVTAVVGKPARSQEFDLVRTILTNNSMIIGYAGNAVASGGSLGCIKDTAGKPVLGCSVNFRLVDAQGAAVPTKLTDKGTTGPTSTEKTSDTGPTPYILSTDGGLPPGLYELTISSPGFIPATVSVRVPLNAVAAAPQVSLFPANTIAGKINTLGSFNHDDAGGINCVVAVPVGYKTSVFDIDKFTCDEASTDTTKPDRPSTIAALTGQCTELGRTSPGYGLVQDDGTYTIPGLCDGRYSTYVVVGNSAYDQASVPSADQTVTHGQTQLYSPHVARKGVLALHVRELNSSTGVATAPTDKPVLDIDCGAGQPIRRNVPTDASGLATIFGFTSGTATCAISTVVAGKTLSGSTGGVFLFDDNSSSVTVILSAPVAGQYGQVVSTYFTGTQDVKQVALHVTLVTGYEGTTAQTVTRDVTTDAHGCFAIVPTTPAPTGTVAAAGCTGGIDVSSTSDHVIVIDMISQVVTVSADAGNATEALNDYQVTLHPLTAASPPAQIPVPAAPASTAGLEFATEPSGLSLSGATLTVENRQAMGSGTIAAGINAAGQLSWQDSNIGEPDEAWQGTYSLKVEVPGFPADMTATLACSVVNDSDAQPTCTLTPASFAALGALDGDVRSPVLAPPHTGTVVLPNAQVLLRPCTSAANCPTAPDQTSACPTASVHDFATTTDGAGHYDFNSPSGRFLPTGTYQVVVCAPQQRTTTISSVTVNGGANNHQNVTTTLLGGVSGVVTDSTTNNGLNGAVVVLYSCATTCTQVSQTTTDGGGNYLFTGAAGRYFLDPGAWKITISATGFDSFEKSFTVGPDGTASGELPDHTISTTLAALGALGGIVTNLNTGVPVNTATLTLVQCSADGLTCPTSGGKQTTVDGGGVYQFSGTSGRYFMTPGKWQMTVKAPGFTTSVVPLTIFSGDNDGSTQLAPLGSLSGTVIDDFAGGGDGIANPTVTAKLCSTAACTSVDSTTIHQVLGDSFGNFAFTGNVLTPGTWQLTVSANGFTTNVVPTTITSGANTATIKLTALGSLSGTIFGNGVDVQQLSGAKVTATCQSSAAPSCAGTVLRATANEFGHYSFAGTGTPWAMAVGQWQVTATEFGYLLPPDPVDDHVVSIASGANTADLTLDVNRVNEQLHIQIGSTSPKKFTTHATVTIAPSDDLTNTTTLALDTPGKFYKAPNLLPRSYSVTVTGDNTSIGQSIVTTIVRLDVDLSDPATTQDVNIPVSVYGASVTGTVVGPTGASATAPVDNAAVQLTTDGTTPALDASDLPMTATTASNGKFTIGGVPNGTYTVRVNGPASDPSNGYQPLLVTPQVTVAFGQPQDIGTQTLVAVTQTATVKVTYDVGDDLTGTTAATLVPADGHTWATITLPTPTTTPAVNPTTSTYTVNNLPFGCWKLDLHLDPAVHPATPNLTVGAGGCTSGFAVSPAQTPTSSAATYKVDERVLTLNTTITPNPDDPAAVPVVTAKVTNSASVVKFSGPVTDGSATIVYVLSGTYSVTATTPRSTIVWPTVVHNNVAVTTSTSVALDVKEATSAKLHVAHFAGADSTHPLTVDLKCTQSQDFPSGCATLGSVTDTDTGTGADFTGLAQGTWYIHLTGTIAGAHSGDPDVTIDKHQTVTLAAGNNTTGGWTNGP